MARAPKRTRRRYRVGRVSYYLRRGSWHIYYREGQRTVRRRVGSSQAEAAEVAAQVNAQLTCSAPTMFSFRPIGIAELIRDFVDHHEHVLNSSLATVSRYRSALRHLENFAAAQCPHLKAHELEADRLVRYLRTIKVAPNGHARTLRRPLRDKGLRYVLEVCRSLYNFAARRRHLPPYGESPFAALPSKRIRIENAKPIFIFDADSELKFLRACDDWGFPLHLTLAKSGLRIGEVVHLLIEDLDLDGGWMHVRSKVDLGWRIKTGRERKVPLIGELVSVLRAVIGTRTSGPVFLRPQFDPFVAELGNQGSAAMVAVLGRRVAAEEHASGESLSRARQARSARLVWRDAGAIRNEIVRHSFMATNHAIGQDQMTCPKSWRHTFATLLQDANVDPLIRQLTLGHSPSDGNGALGMTGLYTHTRPQTQQAEIIRAMQLWPKSLGAASEWAEASAARQLAEALGVKTCRSPARP